ncbi:MAG: long-chain fatty acid--CoA ligase, partial [Acidimicrobiia bacterium]|nr:long-chain fatty acid--CoA ligase [Acidimicrobiia bacterium]
GYNVYPVEVEAVLTDHPAIEALAIVPASDPVMGEVGVAVMVARDPDRPPSLDELRSFAADRLARYKLPEATLAVDALPLTAGDKIDRSALRSMVETADLTTAER